MSKVTLKVEIDEEVYKQIKGDSIYDNNNKIIISKSSSAYYALNAIINAAPITESDDCVSRQKELTERLQTANATNATLIKLLEGKQKPCDDAISRSAVLNYISRLLNQGTGKKKSFEFMQKYVKKLPSVNPQKIGHWIEEFNDIEGEVRFTCSSCGEYQLFETDFCSECGAKMVDEQESEDT